jgi:hypothetical protein
MYKGLCCRRDKKKEKLSKSKWVQKQKSQKKGEPKAKPNIVLDAILLRRPRSSGPFSRVSPRFPPPKKKKQLNSKIEKEVARRTKTQKIRIKIRTITQKTVIGLTGRLQARSPADR